MTDFHTRSELINEVRSFSPNDAYHEGVELDPNAYYAATDRVIELLEGKIKHWTDLKPRDDG